MNRIFLVFFLFSRLLTYSQEYDNNWVFGYYPTSIIDFSNNNIDTFFISKATSFWDASTSVSSYYGELLFFSNGQLIKDKNGDTIEGGGYFFCGLYDAQTLGTPYIQGALLLPMPDSDSLLYFFHQASADSSLTQANKLYYSIVDATANSGKGAVISKENLLIDTFITDAGMGLCKHANGVDWWLIKPKYKSNTYFKFLVKGNGVIHGPFVQSIGAVLNDPDWGQQIVFDVEGFKMARAGVSQRGQLFEFDRCTGILSNPRDFFDVGNGFIYGGGGVSFSPNGRYLYMTGDSFKVKQYDTYQANLNMAKVTINSNSVKYQIFYHQLGPDGKIYIAGYNSPSMLAVINYPDSVGSSCALDTFSLSYYPPATFGMPCFPHYRTPPSAAYAAEAGRDTTVCDSLLQLSVGISLGAPAVDSVVYAWSSPNDAGFGGSSQAQVIVHPTSSAMYVLHIQDTSLAPKYSCTERWDTVHVTVTSNCFTSTPKSPKGDLSSQMHVSPNPARDYFFVETDMRDAVLTVTDAEGRLVQKLEIRNQKAEIRCSGWARGVYFVTVRNKESEKRVKVVVE